ncbi:Glycosyl transferase family 2 [Tranquillimonas rosea]|uniref:Glycosyl transferase family 2 n=1 Tax=Tranquillimonas rosea TaxID=641238 RepID=A0A1H9V5B6_9RHOB|nr:glycosyltransferase family 2 protein [Tranquillimonas rosea]SES16721.1 Glycosyl transferase family 2 [Tranquillimonas rosea]
MDGASSDRKPRLPQKPVSRHGCITAVSMMKDEGPFVLEWIAHHLAVGFTDLVVFTNDCTDGTDDMLIRLEELGLAHHRRNIIPEGVKPQPSAIKHAQADPLVGQSDWLMVFDADEFLCVHYGDGTLDDLLDAVTAEGANGLVVTWRIFGSGGVQHWSRQPVTEQFLNAAPPMWNKGWGVKTLFRHDPERWKLGIHRPSMKNKVLDTDYPHGIKWLNGSGQETEEYFKFRGWRSIMRTVGYDWVQMNHYAVKSIDAFALRRLRGNVNNKANKYDSGYWALQDRNEVRDDSMLRYSAARKHIFDGLLSDPVLSRLHHAALDSAEARLADFKDSAAYEPFVAELKAASQVPITAVSAKPPKERDPEKIAARMSEIERRAGARHAAERRADGRTEVRPTGLYVLSGVDMSTEPPMERAMNHSIELPADPGIFTPPALTQIMEGKFERNLARNLPKLLPRGARYVEIGAASGFVAGHLRNERPDLDLTVQESDPERMRFIGKLWKANGIDVTHQVRLEGAPVAADAATLGRFLADSRPDVLVLGDPVLDAETLEAAVAASGLAPPRQVYLVGRLWSERYRELPGFEEVLHRLGFTERLGLDPQVAAGYRRDTALAASHGDGA